MDSTQHKAQGEGNKPDISAHKFSFHDSAHSLFVFPCLGQQAALNAFHTMAGSTSLYVMFLRDVNLLWRFLFTTVAPAAKSKTL